ncbi:unnamed protein product [Sphagnum tenellum]
MDVEKGVIQVRNGPGTKVEVLPLNVVNMLQVLEGSEDKCNVWEEIFNRKMGQLQIKDWADLLGALDFEDFNDDSFSKEETTEYEGRTKDGPKKIMLNMENKLEGSWVGFDH